MSVCRGVQFRRHPTPPRARARRPMADHHVATCPPRAADLETSVYAAQKEVSAHRHPRVPIARAMLP